MAWLRFGRPAPPTAAEEDPLLDRVMPAYDVAERHSVRVAAPAEVTFAAACGWDLMQLPPVRLIFKARQVLLGGDPGDAFQRRGLLALTKSLGWGTLAEVSGREIVMGAVTQPWRANVVFRPLPLDQFVTFDEPGYVKIAWTLRADPTGANASIFRTETRAAATDVTARAKFRWYWARFSPGILLIRQLSLGSLRRDAERRAAALVPRGR